MHTQPVANRATLSGIGRAAVALPLVSALAACASPHERAEKIALEKNPVHGARVGDTCRYSAVRDGQPHEATAEQWSFRVAASANGVATIDVSVLGPMRKPPSPSPREPGFTVQLLTAEGSFDAAEVIRLFHRPELTPVGMMGVIDRENLPIEGSSRAFPLKVLERTRQGRELTVTFSDGSLERATYRVVFADELPVVGIAEAELDEEWRVTDPDGKLHAERRHEKLELVDVREAAAK